MLYQLPDSVQLGNTILFCFLLSVHPAKHTASVSKNQSSVTLGNFITMQIVFLLQENNVSFLSADNYSGDHYCAGCKVRKQPHTVSCQTW